MKVSEEFLAKVLTLAHELAGDHDTDCEARMSRGRPCSCLSELAVEMLKETVQILDLKCLCGSGVLQNINKDGWQPCPKCRQEGPINNEVPDDFEILI